MEYVVACNITDNNLDHFVINYFRLKDFLRCREYHGRFSELRFIKVEYHIEYSGHLQQMDRWATD
jgi:hypothetical protein